jgi:hypothetical protein
MKILKDSIWQYVGPQTNGVPHGQLHKVAISKPDEVVTIGIPLGTGGSWLGPTPLFLNHFVFKYEKL